MRRRGFSKDGSGWVENVNEPLGRRTSKTNWGMAVFWGKFKKTDGEDKVKESVWGMFEVTTGRGAAIL